MPHKKNVTFCAAFLLLCYSILFSSPIPRFIPEPMLVDISVHSNYDEIDRKYVMLGQSFFADYLKLPPFTGKCDFTDPTSLFHFISYIANRYSDVKEVGDIMDFTYVENHDTFERFIHRDGVSDKLVKMYKNLDYIEYVIGWFHSADVYCAYLKMHGKNRRSFPAIMLFTFRTGEWKVLSGISFSGQFSQDILIAGMRGDLNKNVQVIPIPDALSAIKDRVLSEKTTIQVALPISTK